MNQYIATGNPTVKLESAVTDNYEKMNADATEKYFVAEEANFQDRRCRKDLSYRRCVAERTPGISPDNNMQTRILFMHTRIRMRIGLLGPENKHEHTSGNTSRLSIVRTFSATLGAVPFFLSQPHHAERPVIVPDPC